MKRISWRYMCVGILTVLCSAACRRESADLALRSGGANVVPPTPSALPEAVAVPAATIESGFASDVRHDTHIDVAAFRIAKRPVTVSQYQRCVVAGACTEPASKAHVCTSWNADYDPRPSPYREYLDRPTYGVSGDLPVTCVQFAQAAQYCAWVGGQLPTLPQWWAAARGEKATRYSWG